MDDISGTSLVAFGMLIMVLVLAFVMGAAVAVWGQVGFQAAMLLQSSTTVAGQPIQFPLFRNQITALRAELAPGGQTGRHMHPVPTFVYVLEGELTVEAEGHGTGVQSRGRVSGSREQLAQRHQPSPAFPIS